MAKNLELLKLKSLQHSHSYCIPKLSQLSNMRGGGGILIAWVDRNEYFSHKLTSDDIDRSLLYSYGRYTNRSLLCMIPGHDKAKDRLE